MTKIETICLLLSAVAWPGGMAAANSGNIDRSPQIVLGEAASPEQLDRIRPHLLEQIDRLQTGFDVLRKGEADPAAFASRVLSETIPVLEGVAGLVRDGSRAFASAEAELHLQITKLSIQASIEPEEVRPAFDGLLDERRASLGQVRELQIHFLGLAGQLESLTRQVATRMKIVRARYRLDRNRTTSAAVLPTRREVLQMQTTLRELRRMMDTLGKPSVTPDVSPSGEPME